MDQLTPSQEMVEAILPETAQNPTVSKPPKARKRAFRRSPLLATSTIFKSQPVEASLDTSTADGISSLQAESHETPQHSKWSIGNLFQPTRPIEKHFDFSPLAPVSECPESFPQTPTTSTAKTLSEEAPPTEPKNKRSSPTSAKDARAKHRRHNDAVIKPVQPTTARKNERDGLSRAREAIPASGGTETNVVEEEQFPDTRASDRAQGEARQAEVEEPTAKPTIRWPSRWLDRLNLNKRKRWGEPVATPSPDSGSYGLGETDLYGNSEEDGVTEQPGKIRRTGESREFTSQVAEDPSIARPYKYQGTNVFAEDEAAQKAAKQSQLKTPIPITNSTGTFKVPSPGDSDWSDSDSEEEEGSTAGLEDMTPFRNNNGESALANPRFLQLKLPKPQRIPPLTQSEALRKAREKLLKHKPRNPSKLIQSSRAYPSPPSRSEGVAKRDSSPLAAAVLESSTAVDLELTGPANFTAFKDWRKTASLAVTAALETMEVDSNVAGNAFARGLEDTGTGRTNRYTAFKEWSKTAPPTVIAVVENTEIDSNFAGQAFKSGLDYCTEY